MIQKLLLQNFQKHEKLVLDLDSNVTTLVGRSDVGKSAIIRAIGFALLNRPSRLAFVREGSSKTKVCVRINGKTITRSRGKNLNVYKLDDKEYRSFGNDVPDDIKKIASVNSDINFQFQLEPPFLFLESAGQVSKKLNAVINLGAIDQALNFISKEISRKKTEVNYVQESLDKAKETRQSLQWVGEMKAEYDCIRALSAQIVANCDKRNAIAKRLQDVSELKLNAVRRSEGILGAQKLASGLQALQLTASRRLALEKLLDRLELQQEIASKPKPNLSSVQKYRLRADEVCEQRRGLDIILADLKMMVGDKCRIEKELSQLRKSIQERKCPLCEQALPESQLQSLPQTGTSPLKRRLAVKKKIG